MKIGIIGGGAAGLAAAWDCTNAGHETHVFEAGETVGGLAAGFKDDSWDWYVEKFYHHWFTTDNHLLGLAAEAGLRDKVFFPRPKTSYWMDGEPVRSEMGLSALQLPLSLPATLRMVAAGGFLKFLVPQGQWLEQFTADAWLSTYMGEEAHGKFFRPLLIGKFADQYDKVNMAWMWARIKTRSIKLGTYEGGFQQFLEDLETALLAKGALVHLSAPVDAVELDDDLKPVLTVKGEKIVFDKVISTTSPRLMLKLTPRLNDTHYGDQMAELHSIGAVVVVYALKNQLLTDGTYWLNLPAASPDKGASQFPYLALVEHTNYLKPEDFGGDHIVYAGDYVPPTHDYFKLKETQLADLFSRTFDTFNPNFKPDWIRKTWVFRAPYAQPVPFVYQSERIPPLETPLPGVYWASMSQVYPWDRGTNFAVEIGRRVARLALEMDD